jgi:3-deoxy-D-manno-octulosonate 8-phosphate phosphatase (KDO 8-P phosphatase)
VALLSGRRSPPVAKRAAELGIPYVLEDCHFKRPALEQLLESLHLKAEQVAYVGDDLPDLPVLQFVGFSAAVADAVEEVKSCVDYVTTRPGGSGAVREVIEYILKSTGKWQTLMQRYQA